MDETTLMNDGLTLMLFGMGFVFIFLTLLVFATSLMSKIITRYEVNVGVIPEDGVPSPTAVIPQSEHVNAAQATDNIHVSVIGAAIKKFRSKHK
jgi:oxaloacetate decarboxylase gamma subunit